MRNDRLRAVAIGTTLLVTLGLPALGFAAGAVNISACQVLATPNTVYKLTQNLEACGDCLAIQGDRITVDLQGRTISSTCPTSGTGVAIGNGGGPGYDLTVVKNGNIFGFRVGVQLEGPRTTVLGIESSDNAGAGIDVAGDNALIKSCITKRNGTLGIVAGGERVQVQQCDVSENVTTGMLVGPRCLVTMNTVNVNGATGISASEGCTLSFNTMKDNSSAGLSVSGTKNLVTQNTATGNNSGNDNIDYIVNCPSDVTNNLSSNGFPDSYKLTGSPACRTVNNQ